MVIRTKLETATTLHHATETSKETLELELPSGRIIEAVDDRYSDRLRCDHPVTSADGEALGELLLEQAERLGRGRVVALVDESLAPGMERVGLEIEGVMPGFYAGESNCAVMGAALDEDRDRLANPLEIARVDELLETPRSPKPRPDIETHRATLDDAERIADLLGEVFSGYPTPSNDLAYIRSELERGVPMRFVEQDGQLAACASADIVPEARTAELTDCATLRAHHGKGFMRAILIDLMEDLRQMDYPTAFTLTRARIPGVNIVFQRLGFEFQGRMASSCLIGEGIEDMNIMSRAL